MAHKERKPLEGAFGRTAIKEGAYSKTAVKENIFGKTATNKAFGETAVKDGIFKKTATNIEHKPVPKLDFNGLHEEEAYRKSKLKKSTPPKLDVLHKEEAYA